MPRNFGGMHDDGEKEPAEIAVKAAIIAFIIGMFVGAILHSCGLITAYITP